MPSDEDGKPMFVESFRESTIGALEVIRALPSAFRRRTTARLRVVLLKPFANGFSVAIAADVDFHEDVMPLQVILVFGQKVATAGGTAHTRKRKR